MREIKFRGLRVDGKGLVHGGVVITPNGSYIIVPGQNKYTKNYYTTQVEVIPETVGQYLGFKASGVDVYDGDLIAYYGGMEGREIGYSEDGRLVWKTPHGHFTISARELYDELQMQVIGNIHENNK